MTYRHEQQADWQLGATAQSAPILTGPQCGTGRRLIYDAEGDGILFDTYLGMKSEKRAVTKFWCIACIDVDTEEEFYWGVDQGEDSLAHGVRFLQQASLLLAHHGIGYDYPATERLYPWFTRPAKSWDTLVIAKVIWPYESLISKDLERIRAGKMPPQLLKAHSLKAWGYRTGTHKGEYLGGFDEWCPAMAVYLMGDVRGTLALWRLMERKMGWDKPVAAALSGGAIVRWPELTIEVECEVARIIAEQEWCGVKFDVLKAIALAQTLKNEQARIEEKLVTAFGSWWEAGPVQTAASTTYRKMAEWPDVEMPRVSPKTGKLLKPYIGPPLNEVTEGSTFQHIERVTYSPTNRYHLGKRLQDVYGWKPKAFGANGAPTVDETTLEEIPEAVLPADMRQLILDHFVVSKTLGTLSKGKKAWITMAEGPCPEAPWHEMGRIHGQMDTCGAVTRRGTHKNPNLSGTPAVLLKEDASGIKHPVLGLEGRYGWECRELFCADEGWELTGADASSLELIDLGHYLTPLDGGAFSSRVCDPSRSPHDENAKIAGGMTKAEAKTTIYLLIYGGSAYKLSLAVEVTDDEIPRLITYKGLPALLKSLAKRFDDEFVAKLDDRQLARISKARQIIVRLKAGIVGLEKLMEGVQEAAGRGWLKSIDGSTIIVRKPFAALNSLLQSAGAISCKLWMMLVHQELKRRGLVKGVDFKQVLWVHDELQFTHRPGLGPIILEVAEQCMVEAGVILGLRGRYRTAGKTATNWAQTH